jgi:arylsulfatase A-like enzyme
MRKSILLICGALVVAANVFAGKAEHVVVVVWDGLRPDMVNAANTPVLSKFARDGVFFANHHPAYISSTEVNGIALATGAHPANSGIMANREYWPPIDPLKPIATEAFDTVRKGDAAMDGRYIGRPTLAEILQRAGKRTVIAGSKPVALLHDRGEPGGDSVTLFAGRTLPADAGDKLKLGVFPSSDRMTGRRGR